MLDIIKAHLIVYRQFFVFAGILHMTNSAILLLESP